MSLIAKDLFMARREALLLTLALFAGIASGPIAVAQAGKRPLTINDYERWQSIDPNPAISADGVCVAYVVRYLDRVEQKPILHVTSLDSEAKHEIPNAIDPIFSDDSRWVAAFVALPYEEAKVLRDKDKPLPRKGLLLDLVSGARKTWENVDSFEFARGSGHLLVRRPRSDSDAEHSGADVILRDLRREADRLIVDVGEASFNRSGELLAYAVDAAQRDTNGIHLIDLRGGVQNTLDSDAFRYAQLTWNEAGTAFAFVKGTKSERSAERDNVLLAYTDAYAAAAGQEPVGDPARLDPQTAPGFPSGFVISERGPLGWSKDRGLVFLGIKEQRPEPDPADGTKGTHELANVDIWHWRDPRIQSEQFMRAETDRNFTYRAAFDVSGGRFIQLTDATMSEIDLAPDSRWGVGRNERAYLADWSEPRADLYRVDTSTGKRTPIVTAQILAPPPVAREAFSHVAGISPDGRTFLYWRDGHYHAYDLDVGTTRNLTQSAPVSFVDMEFDWHTVRPAYGVAGWSKAGDAVILRHRYDLWLQPLHGIVATNLTGGIGTDREIVFRYFRTDPEERAIDLSEPVLLSAYGQWTKKSGFYELRDGTMVELMYEDADFGRTITELKGEDPRFVPLKARSASRYLFTRESFVEFPDLWVADAGFTNRRRITNVNPQQAEYLWGRRLLFDYTDRDGTRLQGALAVPDDYQPGQRRPMLVDFYEYRSEWLHRHVRPKYVNNFGRPLIESVSQGYLIMAPDVDFDSNAAHADILECIEAAVEKVIEMGYADPERIAIHGSSFGGQAAAYIATRSDKFAAVGMGAGITEMAGDFSRFWGWSYPTGLERGRPNANHVYILSQGRFGTDPWSDPEIYREQSAYTHVRTMDQPLMIVHGTMDPTINVMEGLQFYNGLRFHGKNVIMLAYAGEGHNLGGRANKRDFTIRAMQFFDHHLRGAPARRWMTEGVPYLEKGLRRKPK